MHSSKPLISVIVPVYNTAPFLDRCIGSILAQTHENLEVLLVNDGSTDGSGGICDGYAHLDARVRVIHRENGGLSAARNDGLDRCTGAYIAFVDSDDYILPDMYETMLHALLAQGASLCVCPWQYQRLDGEWVVDPARADRSMFGAMSSLEFARGLYKGAYENGLVVSACNKLYRRELLEKQRFSGRYAEDDALHTQLLSRDFPVYVLEKPLYIYTENPASLTHRGFRRESLRILEILAERTQVFRHDPFLVRGSKRTYCNLYIEYTFKARAAGIPMPDRRRFRAYVRDLAATGDCGLKFLLRMGLFLASPGLYEFLLGR